MCRRAAVIRSLLIFLVLAISAARLLADNTRQQNKASAESQGHFPYTNRLITSRDPYLLLHAHNPVDWYPWGDEASVRTGPSLSRSATAPAIGVTSPSGPSTQIPQSPS